MDVTTYKVLHVAGVLLLFLSLGAILSSGSGRKGWVICHGVGLALLLVSGFGMLARLGIHWPWPGWILMKVAAWLLLGAAVAAIRRLPDARGILTVLVVLIGVAAGYAALFKPFI